MDYARLTTLVAMGIVLSGCGGGGGGGGGGGSGTAKTHTVGGALTGLAGTGLTLQLNGAQDLTPSSNGSFSFSTGVAEGSSFSVTVKTQPSTPSQTCAVANGGGTMSTADVSNVAVTCTTSTYSAGGTLSGLAGSGLVLQLNGSQDLTPSANGSFSFATAIASGTAYSVTVKTQPASPSQTCAVTNGSGTIGAANVSNVTVNCATSTYSVGGTVSGLAGSGLVLQLNGNVDQAVTTDGTFSFDGGIASGSTYAVTVKTQPSSPSQTCTATGSSGVVGGSAISIALNCTTNTYGIGALVTGLAGSGLVLRLNGTQDLPIGANGTFSFPATLASGSQYTVTTKTQPNTPSQTCTPASGSGVVGGGAVTVTVNCTTSTYTVGGSVSGLTGSGLVLQLNGGQDLAVNAAGTFLFPTGIQSGNQYAVTVKTQTGTFREICAVTGGSGSGTIAAANVSNVTVDCSVVLGFTYMVGDGGGLRGYGIHPLTGALLPLSPNPLITVPSGSLRMVAAPNGSTLYLTNLTASTVRAIAVDVSKGTLTPIGAPIPTGTATDGAFNMAITPSGKFLYVTNTFAANVVLFSIDSTTGALTSAGEIIGTQAGAQRIDVAITPDGAFLYAQNYLGASSTVTVYSLDPTTGALTAGATLAPTGKMDAGMTIDPLGKFLYLRLDEVVSPQLLPKTTILPFAIDPGTGALSAVAPAAGILSNGAKLAIEPSGQFAYLLDSYNISAAHLKIDTFSIDQTTGVMTNVGTSVPTNAQGDDIVAEPSGKFLILGSFGYTGSSPSTWYDFTSFAIGAAGPSAGQLTLAGTGTASTAYPALTGLDVVVIE